MYTAINDYPGVQRWPLLDPGLHQRRRALPVEVKEAFERLTRGRWWRAAA
jgi:hypothetical protein